MSDTLRHQYPAVTVDIVTILLQPGDLQVLLIRRKKAPFEGAWALPGGYVEPYEPLEDAARRELWEETGAEPPSMEQLHTFGNPDRDPRGWTISVAYLTLLSPDEVKAWRLRAASDASEVRWFKLKELPPLAFDHACILAVATKRLASLGRV
jgi:8-oxo-dGTP diphosphatase